MKPYKLILTLVLTLASNIIYAQEATTFILMRHAEKVADGTEDPVLTPEGEARAERLKNMLASQDVKAIFSTPYKRTKLTVEPLAEHKSLDIQEYQPFTKGFISELLEKHTGGTVVISGHSNTIPLMVNELIGADKFEQLTEDDYNDLFIVTVMKAGEGKEVVINY
ncbi:MAG: phosphoglycerate mutase family protein [Marinoscillum sp.]